MAFTKDDADAIRRLRKGGVARVRQGDEDILYRSDDELRRLQKEMEAEAAPAPAARTVRIRARSGW
ncbi:phage head-tail joining protein [Nitrospirillum iridis]|uniref:Uncharacterized protein n=1 Tax=Nitrospirillum iridis TaxID=765888 RepID=A0A7X0AWM0_9PROT|nr:hypothetical protein [Nitrospirillum iridis]MBB6251420.1 hypothetical protein [Nitrospirillum iridis]